MNDRELEQRLRGWYHDAVGETEPAPADLLQRVTAIPVAHPIPMRPSRRNWTLLAAAALLLVGGAVAAGSGLLRPTPVVLPSPSVAMLTTPEPEPTASSAGTPAPAAAVRNGDLIAFSLADNTQACTGNEGFCRTPRIWTVQSTGSGAHERFGKGEGRQELLAWTPDGSDILYSDRGSLYLADPADGAPLPLDLGCPASEPGSTAPGACARDSGAAFSSDGRHLLFLRATADADGYGGSVAIATMDLETGQVSVLTSTSPSGGVRPGWSPDASQIVFGRYGEGDTAGPTPPTRDAVFIVDVDGQNLHQVSPLDLDAIDPVWSPDGATIAFMSRGPQSLDGAIYTMRPDGGDVRRLTSGGGAVWPTWTPDGRILFTRASAVDGQAAGWWVMDADGTDATLLASASTLRLEGLDLLLSHPMIQPIGGAAILPPPWTVQVGVPLGPPPPTPEPTPVPALAAGFSWTDVLALEADGTSSGTATLLADGRVLFTQGCGTAAAEYDPSTGAFTETGSMTVARSGKTATRLADGRVLFTGGINCGKGGDEGIWASAEVYDPTTGTFTPTGSMTTHRYSHTATLLTGGRVLIAGGMTGPAATSANGVILADYRTVQTTNALASAELYDPATGTFSKTGRMTEIRNNHTATLLDDGRVLMVGGGGDGYDNIASADMYDPATGTFSATDSLKTGRYLHTATLLADGRVLVTGGRSPRDTVYKSAEVYDPRTGRFASTAPMVDGRQEHTATLLADGRVLITGGYWTNGDHWSVLSSAEVYDPATGTFSPIGSMGTARAGHTATRLGDGRVLIAGGSKIGVDGATSVAEAVLYQPSP